MPDNRVIFPRAGIDFNIVPTMICRDLKNEMVRRARRVLSALTVLNNLKRRKIFESRAILLVKITGRIQVTIDVKTIKKSKEIKRERNVMLAYQRHSSQI